MTCEAETQAILARLAEDLEQRIRQVESLDSNRRTEGRRPIMAECSLYLLRGDDPAFEPLDAVVRNISFRGISIIAHPGTRIATGDAVEIRVPIAGRPQTHLAGLVAFCRSVENGYVEVGVEVLAAGAAGILIRDVDQARRLYDWFDHAMASTSNAVN